MLSIYLMRLLILKLILVYKPINAIVMNTCTKNCIATWANLNIHAFNERRHRTSNHPLKAHQNFNCVVACRSFHWEQGRLLSDNKAMTRLVPGNKLKTQAVLENKAKIQDFPGEQGQDPGCSWEQPGWHKCSTS